MSIRMHLAAGFVRLTMKRTMTTVERAHERINAPKGSSAPGAAIRKQHRVSHREVMGFDVYSVVPRNGRWNRAVLYLHGGAYIGEITPQHYGFISRLVDAGVRVDVPIYGLAPQHTAVAAYDLVAAAYRTLVEEVEADHVCVMGDSAGGGLALGFVQELSSLDMPAPGTVVLISPWLDAMLSNPDIPAVEKHDPWLSSVGLREAAIAWAGELSPTDPRVSPLRGTVTGLPPIDIWCGTRDLFHPDVVRLAQMITDAGGQVRLTECAGAIHVYPVLPTPEGRAATREIVDTVSSRRRV